MFKNLKKQGFALAEVVVALIFISMAIMLVAGLGQQVMELARSSKQTAAVIELRAKSNSISRNLDSWLAKMRSSVHTSGVYAACIPDPSAASSIFKCPTIDENILTADSELKKIAGTQLHASGAVVIDLMGDKIAGTAETPVYFDLDGRKCEGNKCPLKSTGYMLRSNPDENSNPGAVRFVLKIEPNNGVANRGGTPLRTQYFSIDVGSEWNESSGFCPSGSIKVGYLSNGNPNCVNPTKKCATGKINLGLDSSSNPICKDPPSCVSGGAIIDPQSNELVCSSTSPCAQSQIFLGYYSGTGIPMCSSTNMSCPNGQVQVGIHETSGNLAALCKQLPSCNDSQKLSYDGSQFVCQSASIASNCAAGEVVVGINTDGSAKCEAQSRLLASSALPDTGSLTLRTPGTTSWTVPSGVSRVSIEIWGGGGAGCGGAGGSGGGAGYSLCKINVTPGETLQLVVGAGGTGGAIWNYCPSNILDGKETSINRAGVKLCSASGGTGGNGGWGESGVGTGGILNIKGEQGKDIFAFEQMMPGGAAPRGGAGGNAYGGPGNWPGGGGGASWSSHGQAGGAGADGGILVQW